MERKTLAPIIKDPVMLDKAIGQLQKGLADNIRWLDVVFGRAQRLTRVVNGKTYKEPHVYAGGTDYAKGNNHNDYICVSPDAKIGNFAFFDVLEPHKIEPYNRGIENKIKTPFALVVWVDLRKVYNEAGNRNTEALKAQLLRELNGGFTHPGCQYTFNRIYEQSENVYKGYNLDETTNQFLMHPYWAVRLEGEVVYKEPCYER